MIQHYTPRRVEILAAIYGYLLARHAERSAQAANQSSAPTTSSNSREERP